MFCNGSLFNKRNLPNIKKLLHIIIFIRDWNKHVTGSQNTLNFINKPHKYILYIIFNYKPSNCHVCKFQLMINNNDLLINNNDPPIICMVLIGS